MCELYSNSLFQTIEIIPQFQQNNFCDIITSELYQECFESKAAAHSSRGIKSGECFCQMAVSQWRDGGAASITVVNRLSKTEVNEIFCHSLYVTLVHCLSVDDEKALKLTISTEVLNMMFLSLLL